MRYLRILSAVITALLCSFLSTGAVADYDNVYQVQIIDVYDGDTVKAHIHIGSDVWKLETLTLARIDAPEVQGDEKDAGLKARDYLQGLMLGKEVTVREIEEKDGRHLAELFVGETNVNDVMVEKGFASYREY